MSQDRSLTAQFIKVWQLDLSASPTDGGSVSGGGTFDDATSPQITATPNAGYRFAGWIGAGVTDPTNASTTVLMSQDRSLTAQFIKVWQLDLSASPTDGGSVSGGGTFDDGTSQQIVATPRTGYHFVTWLGQGTANPTAATTSVLMDQNRTLVGEFELLPDLKITATIDTQHKLKLFIPTVVGSNYQVEHATNLVIWSPLGDPVTGSGRVEEFDTAISSGASHDFFRVVVTQP